MKSKKLPILLAVAALIVSTLACAAGELSLENARLSKDDTGAQAVTTFAPADTFYVVADLNNATTGTAVEAKWYLVNAADFESGPISADTPAVVTIEEDSWTGTVNFSLSSVDSAGWPAGDYQVELYLNGALTHTLDFNVR